MGIMKVPQGPQRRARGSRWSKKERLWPFSLIQSDHTVPHRVSPKEQLLILKIEMKMENH